MEPEESSASTVENIAWFALGTLAGVTIAMLLAPNRGVDTRRRLASQVKSSGRDLFDSGQDLINKGRELYEKGREIAQEAADMFERGRKMAEHGFEEHSERG